MQLIMHSMLGAVDVSLTSCMFLHVLKISFRWQLVSEFDTKENPFLHCF